MKRELVKDWMSANVITVSPTTTVPAAHALMNQYLIRRLPVLTKQRLVGILTLGDLREAEPSHATSLSKWELNYLINRLTVGQVMTANPIVVLPESTIGEAARLMLEHRISGLPVVEASGRVVGIITESDIFRLVVEAWHNESIPAPVSSALA